MSVVNKMEKAHIEEVAGFTGATGVEMTEEAKSKALSELENRSDVFNIGDLVKVGVKVIEGKKERIQIFEGYVIAMRGHGITRTFKVRKVAFNVGVERTFPMYSPKVSFIELVRRGRVRRAKLFYLRERSGKSARIKEKINFKKAK